MKNQKKLLLFYPLFAVAVLFAVVVCRQAKAQYPQGAPPKPEKAALSSSSANSSKPKTGDDETKSEIKTEDYNAFKKMYYADTKSQSEKPNEKEKEKSETPAEPVIRKDESPILQKELEKAVNNKPEKAADESENKTTALSEIAEATSAFSARDYESAIEKLTSFYQKDKTQPPPGIFMAQFSANARQSDQVRRWLDKTTWDYPQDPEAFLLLADFAVQENRLMEARLLVEKGTALLENISQNPKRRQILGRLSELVQGQLYQLRENWEEAKIHLEKLNAIEPKNTDVLTRLGFVTVKLGKYEDAIPYYQQVVDAGSPLPAPKLVVAQLLNQDGKEQEARKLFDEAIKTPNITPVSLRVAAIMQIHWGNIAEAEKLLNQAIQAEPNNIENVNYAGMIALFKKDYSQAEELFAKAILLVPNHPAATNGLALALAEQPDKLKKERAIMYAKNQTQNSQQSPDSLATLAWVFFKSGQMNDAAYLIDPVLFSGDVSSLNAYFLAEIAAAAGQKEKALSLVKAALQSKNHLMKQQEAEALKKKLETEIPAAKPDAKTENKPALNLNMPKKLSEDSASEKVETLPLPAATSTEKPADAPIKLNPPILTPTETAVPKPVLPQLATPSLPAKPPAKQPSVKPELKPAAKPEVKPIIIPGIRSGTTTGASPNSPTLAPPQKR
ncbi:MAG: tetratricopeptide repeat protein [Planctomycetaceae bacterium]|jgi:tetratricopeptide (TPR) repeat protein|nr:tetratricopeptide repeat protein [Planctomycetaceae bacterium]